MASSAVKPAVILSRIERLLAIAGNPPPQEAQIQRDGHQIVADLVGDVRCHLPQIGQAILPRQLAILDFQFVRQPLDFLAQGFVRLLQAQRGVVPSRQHGLQAGGSIERFRIQVGMHFGHRDH